MTMNIHNKHEVINKHQYHEKTNICVYDSLKLLKRVYNIILFKYYIYNSKGKPTYVTMKVLTSHL